MMDREGETVIFVPCKSEQRGAAIKYRLEDSRNSRIQKAEEQQYPQVCGYERNT